MPYFLIVEKAVNIKVYVQEELLRFGKSHENGKERQKCQQKTASKLKKFQFKKGEILLQKYNAQTVAKSLLVKIRFRASNLAAWQIFTGLK